MKTTMDFLISQIESDLNKFNEDNVFSAILRYELETIMPYKCDKIYILDNEYDLEYPIIGQTTNGDLVDLSQHNIDKSKLNILKYKLSQLGYWILKSKIGHRIIYATPCYN